MPCSLEACGSVKRDLKCQRDLFILQKRPIDTLADLSEGMHWRVHAACRGAGERVKGCEGSRSRI